MRVTELLAVFGGAGLGAVLRWRLSALLNPWLPAFPLGTFAANVLGGYLIGVAVGAFVHRPAVPTEVRLLIVTGFLGGLTTFSTFSHEAVSLLVRAQVGWALALVLGHLIVSLAMTALGLTTARALFGG